MKAEIILYNAEKEKSRFTLDRGVRPYGFFLVVSKGRFCVKFPALKESFSFKPYEIAYIPPNTEFERKVIEPIDFHQFSVKLYDSDGNDVALKAGKLNIPESQVKAIINSAELITDYSAQSDALVMHILHRILSDNHLFSQRSETPQISEEIMTAVKYISEHLSERISIPEIASQLHLSHNGLIWKFKKELNVTPLNYIALCRIKRAKQLLLEDNLTVTQIAEECGYANAYYFSNAFKNAEGVSPSAFRKKIVPRAMQGTEDAVL